MDTRFFLDFYYLLTVSEKEARYGNKAQEKVILDAQIALSDLVDNFAPALHDYLALACIGEARFSYGASRHGQNGNYLADFNGNYSRYTVYQNGNRYNAENIFKSCQEVFNENYWGGSYGGIRWANIAAAGLLYYDKRISKLAFVDHCVDLKHNGGLAFNKEAHHVISFHHDLDAWESEFYNFLDFKFSADIFTAEELYKETSVSALLNHCLSHKTKRILERFYTTFRINDGLIPPCFKSRGKSWFSEYKPLKFGNDTLTITDNYDCDNFDTDLDDPCEICERRESVTIIDNYSLCESCYDRYTRICEDCNEVHYEDNLESVTINGESSTVYLCADCLGNYRQCYKCDSYYNGDEIVIKQDLEGYNYEFCLECSEIIETCMQCGNYIRPRVDYKFIVDAYGNYVCWQCKPDYFPCNCGNNAHYKTLQEFGHCQHCEDRINPPLVITKGQLLLSYTKIVDNKPYFKPLNWVNSEILYAYEADYID